MTEIAPMSRGSSPKGAPPASCTGGVPTKSPGGGAVGSNNKANANAIAQGSLTKRNTPASCRCTEQAKVTGTVYAACWWSCMYMRYQKTPRDRHQIGATEPRKFYRPFSTNRIDEPISSQLTRRGGVTWTTSPLVTKPLRPRAVRT